MTALETAEDIGWLRDVHCPNLPADTKFAILYGNEDSPTKVEAWATPEPNYDQKPDYVWEEPS